MTWVSHCTCHQLLRNIFCRRNGACQIIAQPCGNTPVEVFAATRMVIYFTWCSNWIIFAWSSASLVSCSCTQWQVKSPLPSLLPRTPCWQVTRCFAYRSENQFSMFSYSVGCQDHTAGCVFGRNAQPCWSAHSNDPPWEIHVVWMEEGLRPWRVAHPF